MRNYKLKPYLFLVVATLLAVLMAVQTASAAGGTGSSSVSLTTLGSAYSQNFDTLATTGTDIAMSITGWYIYEDSTGAAADGEYRASTGSDNAGDAYSYGAAATAERALGSLRSGTVIPFIGASFTNNTGSTITSLDIAYTGEMWRAGVASRTTTDQLDFQLSTNATTLQTGTWTDYNSLDFLSPKLNVAAGALNGNDSTNQTALSYTITGLNIASGATFWLRWSDFDILSSDDGLSVDSFSITPNGGVVDNPPTVTGTSPANSATNVALNADITVTFSEAVTVSGAWYTISCAASGTHTASVSGGPTTFTLNPDTNFSANEICTVTIESTLVADQDGTADNMAADYVFSFTTTAPVAVCGDPATAIHTIQGSGASSPIANTSGITIEGVVVGDFQDTTGEPPNELNGYFVQEEDDDVDADPNTSEGIFVFEGANPTSPPVINIGDTVRVTGTVIEFGDVPGGTLTELTTLTNVQVCAGPSGAVSSATVTLPVTSLSEYETIENMAVSFPQELTVTEVFTLGRFGEVLLAAGGRLDTPTAVAEPGAPAQAVRDANILRSIMLDDGLTNQNPDPVIYPAPGLSAANTLRGGDTTTGLNGVMHFLDTTEDYRVQPTGTVAWDHENPRPTDAPAVPGSLKVVGSNTLNYFTTLTTAGNVCGPANNQECRGANTAQEFTRQHDKLINMLLELDADIVGLNELENNSAASPANDDNDPVLESIVDALNGVLGAGTYDFIDTGAIGTDAIKVGLIYKPASVTPVNNFEVLTSAYDPDFIDTRNRPVLAQTFEDANDGVFTVAVAHLKSKGSACGGAPDDQPDTSGGNCNGTRTAAAEVMVDWFAEATVNNGDPDILLVGDLNSYAKEDPIDVFVNAGYIDLAATLSDPYSYVFDGEWGYLDYGMAGPSLVAQVAGVAEWHINADEPIALDYNTEFKTPGQVTSFYDDDPFRVSDHDPILVGLNLTFPDTTPPNTTITNNPPNPSGSNGAFFQYNSSEGGNQFECQLDGSGWTDCDGGQVTYGGLTDGSHTFEVRAIDAANNVDPTPASYTWVIDTTAPDTTITGNPPNPSNSANASFTFTGNDGTGVGGVTFECRIDSGAWTACTSPQNYTGLSDGSHTFEVRAKDSLGNTDSTPAGYTWVIDTAGPTVTINQAIGQADPTSASPINFTVVFNEPVTGFATGDVTLAGTAGATTATVTQIAPNNGTTYNVAVSGMTNDGTVTASIGANKAQDAVGNPNAASTSTDNTVTYVAPVDPADIYVSTVTAGHVGAVNFGSEDILLWDGSAWSVWFDGSDAGLEAKNAKHNINAFSIPEVGDEVLISFTQNARIVPGIPGKVDGMDIVLWDGDDFSLVFDGQDVGLTALTHEKIDGLQELDPSLAPAAVQAAAGGSCDRYFLISTAGNGKVQNYTGAQMNISGEDVLGFCATQLGSTTAGKWHMLLNGSDKGVKPNAIVNISASDDGQTLYFTTKAAFNVGGATGGHSMVYAYDMTTGQFSGPHFSAPATGLGARMDGLDVDGDLP